MWLSVLIFDYASYRETAVSVVMSLLSWSSITSYVYESCCRNWSSAEAEDVPYLGNRH